MREIKLQGRSIFGNTKKVLNGICWATYRRGNTPWKGDHVLKIIAQYLWENGADPEVYSLTRIHYIVQRLVQEGYAQIETRGRKYTKFEFFPDVDIRGYTPEFIGRKAKMESFDSDIVFDEVDELPIPTVKPPRYMADELDEVLDKFADKKPEVYAAWAEKMIASVRALLER